MLCLSTLPTAFTKVKSTLTGASGNVWGKYFHESLNFSALASASGKSWKESEKKPKEFSDRVGDFWDWQMLLVKNVKKNVIFSNCSWPFLLLEQYCTGAFSYSSPVEVVEIVMFLKYYLSINR